jgi:hypothetical protein
LRELLNVEPADGECRRMAASDASRARQDQICLQMSVVQYIDEMPTGFAILDVIADPARRRILDAVRVGECSVTELVDTVGMHQAGVSRHFKVLRDAGQFGAVWLEQLVEFSKGLGAQAVESGTGVAAHIDEAGRPEPWDSNALAVAQAHYASFDLTAPVETS